MLTEDPKRTTRTKTIGSRWLNSSTNSWVFISIQFGHELQSNCHIPLFTFYTHYNADLMFVHCNSYFHNEVVYLVIEFEKRVYVYILADFTLYRVRDYCLTCSFFPLSLYFYLQHIVSLFSLYNVYSGLLKIICLGRKDYDGSLLPVIIIKNFE